MCFFAQCRMSLDKQMQCAFQKGFRGGRRSSTRRHGPPCHPCALGVQGQLRGPSPA